MLNAFLCIAYEMKQETGPTVRLEEKREDNKKGPSGPFLYSGVMRLRGKQKHPAEDSGRRLRYQIQDSGRYPR